MPFDLSSNSDLNSKKLKFCFGIESVSKGMITEIFIGNMIIENKLCYDFIDLIIMLKKSCFSQVGVISKFSNWKIINFFDDRIFFT